MRRRPLVVGLALIAVTLAVEPLRPRGRAFAQSGSDITYFDTEFPDTYWQAAVVQSTGFVGHVENQNPTGGNPGAYRSMTHVVNTNPSNWSLSVAHINVNAPGYDPAVSGAIDSIEFSADHIVDPGQLFGVSNGYVLVQGGKTFTTGLQVLTTTWTTLTASCLKEADFTDPVGGTHPSFTANGPIQFGYLRASQGAPTQAPFTIPHGIDNWKVTIHRQPGGPCGAGPTPTPTPTPTAPPGSPTPSPTPVPGPNLTIRISDGGAAWGSLPTDPDTGQPLLSYRVHVTNEGTAKATGVLIRMTYDPALGACSDLVGLPPGPHVFLYPGPDLNPGDSADQGYGAVVCQDEITRLVGGGASFYQVLTRADISSNEADADPSDNASNVATPYSSDPLSAECPLSLLTRPCPFFAISSPDFPAASPARAAMGSSYHTSFTASGGTPPFTYSAKGLPPGISIDASTGIVSGAPTAIGQFDFTVGAEESSASSCQVSLAGSIVVCGAGGSPSLPAVDLPAGSIGQFYDARLPVVCGGSLAPAALSVQGLPAGLQATLKLAQNDATIELAGTPQADGTFSVAVSIGAGPSLYPLTISGCSMKAYDGVALSDATTGTPYSSPFQAAGRQPPFQYSIRHTGNINIGSLAAPQVVQDVLLAGPPFSLSFNSATGLLSGTPQFDSLYDATPSHVIVEARGSDGSVCASDSLLTIHTPGYARTPATESAESGRGPAELWSRIVSGARGAVRRLARLAVTVRDINLYYKVRDKILSRTPGGQALTGLYYAHSQEITQLLRADSTLRDEAWAAMDAWSPGLQQLVDGNGAGATFTPAMSDTMNALLARLKQTGSASLAADIAREEFLLDLSSLVGRTLDQASLVVDAQPCAGSDTALCLGGGRFKVETTWGKPDGTSGPGHAASLTADSGTFWFFDPGNVELIVKALNGCGVDQNYWVFAGGLTNVAVTMTVTDTQTGAVRTYVNPQGDAFAPILDTRAFATCSGAALLAPNPEAPSAATPTAGLQRRQALRSACIADATALCLDGSRFRVEATWTTPDGQFGPGQAIPLSGDSGYFWFFDSGNVEMLIKVLDGCAVDGSRWVFAGGLTNVQVVLTVTDTQTGAVRTYTNPQGSAFLPIQDTSAFAACP